VNFEFNEVRLFAINLIIFCTECAAAVVSKSLSSTTRVFSLDADPAINLSPLLFAMFYYFWLRPFFYI